MQRGIAKPKSTITLLKHLFPLNNRVVVTANFIDLMAFIKLLAHNGKLYCESNVT